jgi:hypothetical protein
MIKVIAVIALIVAILIIGPILTIWSLNTLFPALAIPYAIETWAAVVILAATIRSNVSLKGK